MAKLVTVALGGAHVTAHNTERGLLNAHRTALPGDNIQDLIDELDGEGGGTLYLAVGTHTVPPLVLPRNPSASDLSAVRLVGMGHETVLVGDAASFSSGDALISWEVATARAFQQQISNLTLQLPNVAGVRAIHYQPTSKVDFDAQNAERLQIRLEHLRIIAHNDYHEELIYLEGAINRSLISDIEGDPTLGSGTYNTLLLKTDTAITGELTNDWVGFNPTCVLEHLHSTVIRGGFSRVFEGRLNASTLRNSFCQGGTGPAFKLVNSVQSRLSDLFTEGQSEQPAMFVFDGCRRVSLVNFGVGSPNESYEGAGFGDGIQLIDTDYCTFQQRYISSAKPVYSEATGDANVLLSIDANSSNNTFTDFDVRVGSGGLSAEIVDNGTSNTITATQV